MSTRWPWLSLALVAAAAVLWVLPGQGAGCDWRDGAAAWRLLTCQLTHWDADHLLWDGVAVLLLGAWAETRWPAPARRAVLLGLPLVPLAVGWAHPGLAFRGLSGIACTLAAVGALAALREARQDGDRPAATVAGGLLLLLAAKIAYEGLTGDAVFATADGWVPVPLAHAVGGAIGLGASGRAVMTRRAGAPEPSPASGGGRALAPASRDEARAP